MKKTDYDVLIIGAGISGISAAYHLQTHCPNKRFAILEGRTNFGGTWDLFKYPGIRSDSDMYSLGFSFKPWIAEKAIADGPSIMDYLKETIEDFKLDEHIIYNQHVEHASWSTDDAQWTVEVRTSVEGQPIVYTCNFLSMCSGYYNYEEGYIPDYPGRDNYKGVFIHPQKWPSELDYKDKKILIIGSGATSVTLLPELAKKASHVTMLQRSPTYMVAAPDVDKLANWMNRNLPLKFAYAVSRWRKIMFQRYTYKAARYFPKLIKKILISGVKKELDKDFDIETHFTPKYNPWDERVCLVPNGDLFGAINEKKATVVTSLIDTFTSRGVKLQSGEEIHADIIITATGLSLKVLGGVCFFVDDKEIDFSKTVSYKTLMFSGVPNLNMVFGYVNASWTLKADLVSRYVCRLLKYMDDNGYQQCRPMQNDPSLDLDVWLDFAPGYFRRSIDSFPRSGSKEPWKVKHDYHYDRKILLEDKIDDQVMVFS